MVTPLSNVVSIAVTVTRLLTMPFCPLFFHRFCRINNSVFNVTTWRLTGDRFRTLSQPIVYNIVTVHENVLGLSLKCGIISFKL